MIPFQDVGFATDVEVVRKFQKDFPRNKTFMASHRKPKSNQIFCTDTNCMVMFSTEEELENDLLSQKHEYLDDEEHLTSSKDKVKVLFAQKLKECRMSFQDEPTPLSSSPSTSVLCQEPSSAETTHQFESGRKMGWALRKQRKNVHFNKNQVTFSIDIFNEGEKTNRKKDAITVAEMMQTAKKEDGQKRFSPSEYL